MAINNEEMLFLAQDNSKSWLDAVCMQAERCNAALDMARIETDFAGIDQASRLLRIEQHFFVIALKKAIDWLKELRRLAPVLKPAINRYIADLPHASDVRNMREHDILYVKGKGNHQNKFIYHYTDDQGQVIASSDATGTVVIGDQYLLGARLDVNVAARLSKQLFDHLISQHNKPESHQA